MRNIGPAPAFQTQARASWHWGGAQLKRQHGLAKDDGRGVLAAARAATAAALAQAAACAQTLRR